MAAIVSEVHLRGTEKCKCQLTLREQTKSENKLKECRAFFLLTLEQLKTKNTTAHMPATVSSFNLEMSQKRKCQQTLREQTKSEEKLWEWQTKFFQLTLEQLKN